MEQILKEQTTNHQLLSNHFLDQYKNQKPDWGPVGEITFLRTYSRPIEGENRSEEWWETVRRVVEGTFDIQREHCHSMRLDWKQDRARVSAQTMFRLIFEMKFIPPGRGLWMMGTPFVKKRGSTALNNCAFISTKSIRG